MNKLTPLVAAGLLACAPEHEIEPTPVEPSQIESLRQCQDVRDDDEPCALKDLRDGYQFLSNYAAGYREAANADPSLDTFRYKKDLKFENGKITTTTKDGHTSTHRMGIQLTDEALCGKTFYEGANELSITKINLDPTSSALWRTVDIPKEALLLTLGRRCWPADSHEGQMHTQVITEEEPTRQLYNAFQELWDHLPE